MLLKSYVRNKFKKYVRPLLIKDKCDKCSKSSEIVGLELHHSKPFSELLKECLHSLGYKCYKNKKNYTEIELQNITNWMIGVQMKIKYDTLCEECHARLHNMEDINIEI